METRGDLGRQGGPGDPERGRGGEEKRGSGSREACGKWVDIDVWGDRGGCRSCLSAVFIRPGRAGILQPGVSTPGGAGGGRWGSGRWGDRAFVLEGTPTCWDRKAGQPHSGIGRGAVGIHLG